MPSHIELNVRPFRGQPRPRDGLPEGNAAAQGGEAYDAIDAVGARLDEGSYGECLDCGEAIAEARLEANPTATRCVDCASAREEGRS